MIAERLREVQRDIVVFGGIAVERGRYFGSVEEVNAEMGKL